MSTILKLSADWCSGCKLMDIQLNRLGLIVNHVDIDSDTSYTKKYGVRSIPTLIKLSETGEELGRLVGSQSDSKLKEFFDGI